MTSSGFYAPLTTYSKRLSHIMLYVDGKSRLANPLVNLAVVSYTEQWSALAPAVFLMEEEEHHAHRERRTTPSGRDWESGQTVPVLFQSISRLSAHSER